MSDGPIPREISGYATAFEERLNIVAAAFLPPRPTLRDVFFFSAVALYVTPLVFLNTRARGVMNNIVGTAQRACNIIRTYSPARSRFCAFVILYADSERNRSRTRDKCAIEVEYS